MTTELARQDSLLPDHQTWETMLSMADTLVKSGMLPPAIKTPAAALAIMQKGRELRIPPMYALSNISIIGGKPVTGAELMLAMIYRDHGDMAIQFETTDAEVCEIVYKRRGWPTYRNFSWTIEDAKAANLAGKDVWKAYAPAMLRARCISAVARLAFADTIGGLYTFEEMGVEVTANAEGEIVPVEPKAQIVDLRPTDQPAPFDRAAAEIEYLELADEAINLGHPKAQKIKAVAADSLNDDVLAASIKALEEWIGAQKRVKAAPADEAF
jgi:hypothetical protein